MAGVALASTDSGNVSGALETISSEVCILSVPIRKTVNVRE